MRCQKTVTMAKVEANRKNSKHSTGPRTKRGKRIARFNAVIIGLFAEHVVIPKCDGYEAEKYFHALLERVHGDFQPVGMYEEWLVLKIAECMWRLRRATRCESGSVRESAIWGDLRDDDELIPELATDICALTRAEKQLRNSGTLSQESYAQVLPLVEEEILKQSQSEIESKSVETHFDSRLFLSCITDHKKFLDCMYNFLSRIQGDRSDARCDLHALPLENDMDKILRYEERMHRQLDWAVQRLLESQERRKTTQPPGPLPLPGTADGNKRSQ
jgi:hypothetical protein